MTGQSPKPGPQPVKSMSDSLPVIIVGAGPFGLSLAAHLSAAGVPHRIFGQPMRTWGHGMPAGMTLKSEGFATSLSDPHGAFTLEAYCAERGIPYQPIGWGVPVEIFAAYGQAFQRRFAPHLEEVGVQSVARAGRGFAVTLADGRVVGASEVVLATGLSGFDFSPPEFDGLPPSLFSHSSDTGDFRHLAGRDVAVIGGGASALDVAASLHRAGARAIVVSRRDTVRFYPPRARRALDGLRAPETPLGPGWRKWLVSNAPLLFRLLPARVRHDLVRNHLGPSPAYSVKAVIENHVRVIAGAAIEAATRDGETVRLALRIGAERQEVAADHVIAATGYRVDMGRVACLDPALRAAIRRLKGAPVLSSRFETSVPGLYVAGPAAADTFGPLLRFVCGAEFAARRITARLRALHAASPVPIRPAPEPARAPRIAFLALTNDVGSERIVAQLGREGADCAVIGVKGYSAATRFAARRDALPAWGGATLARIMARPRLERLVAEWRPDRIVPVDDLAARTLRRLATGKRISADLRALIAASLGDPAGYALACGRDGVMTAAGALGLRTPDTRTAPDLAHARRAAAALGFPLVLKREETCGNGGVALIRDHAGLDRAYRRARRRAAAKAALNRLAAAFGGEAKREGGGLDRALGLQRFVPGRLAMRTLACRDGRVLDGFSLVAERQDGEPIGTSTIVAPIEHEEMEAAARALAGLLRVSGFVSFDFLLDEENRAHLIELNPRPIGSTHLGALFGHDLARAYLADLAGAPPAPAAALWAGPVALFPRELARDPSGSGLGAAGGVFHDMPADDPGVTDMYLAYLARLHPAHALQTRMSARPGAVFRRREEDAPRAAA